MIDTHISIVVNVNIDHPPNNVLQTSPEIFAELGNIFITMYPIARVPTEIIAIAASALIFVFFPIRISNIAQITVIGIDNIKLLLI